MEIKLIACDLDGTLLDSRGRLSPENLDAIRRMTDKGYCFVPTSGRNREQIPQALQQFPGIRYLITLSGACVTQLPEGKALFRHPLSREHADRLLRIGKQQGAAVLLYTPEGVLLEHGALEQRQDRALLEDAIGACQQVGDAQAFCLAEDVQVEKAVFFCRNAAQETRLHRALDDGTFQLCASAENCLEVTARGIHKATGIRALLLRLKLLPEQVLTIGDSGNDVSMLELTPNSFAVANAMPEAKRAARHLTVSNDQHVALRIARLLGI